MASKADRYTSAIRNEKWLEPPDLYSCPGFEIARTRPIFQGDVFEGVHLPELPPLPPFEDRVEIPWCACAVMVLPHPCECYHGDSLRPWLTVAPVRLAENYGDFGHDLTGGKDKFPLPDLMLFNTKGTQYSTSVRPSESYVAAFGQMVSIPSTYLDRQRRIASLTHKGLGLLAMRILSFQLRANFSISQTLTYTADQWAEADLMQAWVEKNGILGGYTQWLKKDVIPHPLAPSRSIRRDELLASRPDILMEMLNGAPVSEPL